jgi:hypothetical protein
MKCKIDLFLIVFTASIGLLFFIAPTYGANITIGGDYTNVGTIIFASPKPRDSDTA